MNKNTITNWAKRGWLLDPIVVNGPGKIIKTGNAPYYIGEAKETGYIGSSHHVIASRYAMGMYLGRPLTRNELLRFRSDNKQDLRLSNLILHSKVATSAEMLKANGEPILGYSHCMCGCGIRLNLERQKEQPYAYSDGHRPKSVNDPDSPKRASPSRKKVLVEKLTKKEDIPISQFLKRAVDEAFPTDKEDALKEFRALFEKMIQQLPWEEFKELLYLLLEIQTREKGKK